MEDMIVLACCEVISSLMKLYMTKQITRDEYLRRAKILGQYEVSCRSGKMTVNQLNEYSKVLMEP